MTCIAVDAMGGDHAPSAVVEGAVAAARHLDVRVALVGRAALVRDALSAYHDGTRLPNDVVDAPDVIDMTDAPGSALRRKPRASIGRASACCRSVRKKRRATN